MASWGLRPRAAGLLAASALLACNDLLTPSTHLLIGNGYDPVNDCLNPQQSFDVVDGPAPGGTCGPVCITDAKTGVAYVTDACPPYPVADGVESSDGGPDTCTAALAAWASGSACGVTADASSDASSRDSGDSAAEASAMPDAGHDARGE